MYDCVCSPALMASVSNYIFFLCAHRFTAKDFNEFLLYPTGLSLVWQLAPTMEETCYQYTKSKYPSSLSPGYSHATASTELAVFSAGLSKSRTHGVLYYKPAYWFQNRLQQRSTAEVSQKKHVLSFGASICCRQLPSSST